MIAALKTLEGLLFFVSEEISRVKDKAYTPELCDQSYKLLREAQIDAMNLKRKIEEARAWQIDVDSQPKTQ